MCKGKSSEPKLHDSFPSRSFSGVKLFSFSLLRWWTSAISFMMNVAGVWIAVTSVLVVEVCGSAQKCFKVLTILSVILLMVQKSVS